MKKNFFSSRNIDFSVSARKIKHYFIILSCLYFTLKENAYLKKEIICLEKRTLVLRTATGDVTRSCSVVL